MDHAWGVVLISSKLHGHGKHYNLLMVCTLNSPAYSGRSISNGNKNHSHDSYHKLAMIDFRALFVVPDQSQPWVRATMAPAQGLNFFRAQYI